MRSLCVSSVFTVMWMTRIALVRIVSKTKNKTKNREDRPLLAHLQELYLFVKEYGLILNQELNKKTKHSSSSWSITSRRRWSDWILEIERLSSERFWELSTVFWWNVEEQNARRRREQEKISILYWLVRTRNSLSPSSSRSFRTQSHWSYTAGQCGNPEQFLRVHLSHRQVTLHHKFRIDSERTKFKHGNTDGILNSLESHDQGTQRSAGAWFDQTTSCIVQAKVEKTKGYGVLGRYTVCSTERIEVLWNKM